MGTKSTGDRRHAAQARKKPRRHQPQHPRTQPQPDQGGTGAQQRTERARAKRRDRHEASGPIDEAAPLKKRATNGGRFDGRTPLNTTAAEQRGRPFPKGQSGNPAGRPKGVPNKATIEIKHFCQELFNRPAFLANLLREWDALSLDPTFRTLLTHYAYGKPATMVDLGPRAAASIAKILAGDFEDEEE